MPADHEYDDTKLDSLHPFSTGIRSRLVQICFYLPSTIGGHVCHIINISLKKLYCRESFVIAFYKTKLEQFRFRPIDLTSILYCVDIQEALDYYSCISCPIFSKTIVGDHWDYMIRNCFCLYHTYLILFIFLMFIIV